MTEKTALNQPVKGSPQKKKTASFVVPALLTIAAVGLAYWLLSFTGIFDGGRKTVSSLSNAYQLYSDKDTRISAQLFFGKPQGEGFTVSPVNIFASELQINRIKQLLMALTEGPKDNKAVNLLPEGTALKDAYMDANGILYLDMSPEFASNCKGGTTGEYEAVYSIVNTVFYNFPAVKGVKLTVNGIEKDTLAGHILIRSILTPDEDLSQYK